MTYIENVFICMVSPLLIAALCMGKRHIKFFLCCLVGMGACLLSAYINSCDLWCNCRRRTCVCVAAHMAEDCRNLWSAWSGDHASCDL